MARGWHWIISKVFSIPTHAMSVWRIPACLRQGAWHGVDFKAKWALLALAASTGAKGGESFGSL